MHSPHPALGANLPLTTAAPELIKSSGKRPTSFDRENPVGLAQLDPIKVGVFTPIG
jgi:hypothetical protein